MNKAEYIRQLQSQVPKNDFGLPEGFYRADLLPDPTHTQLFLEDESRTKDDDRESGPSSKEPQTGEYIPFGTRPTRPRSRHEDDQELDIDSAGDTQDDKEWKNQVEQMPHIPTEEEYASERNDDQEKPPQPPAKTMSGKQQWVLETEQMAYVTLVYDEGYPTLPNGTPFWSTLDYEPPEAYVKFQEYLSMVARQVSAIAHDHTDLIRYRQWFYLYHWGPRAKAYDLFREASLRKQQADRALTIEDEHYSFAEKLVSKCMEFLSEDKEKARQLFDSMRPRDIIELLKTAIQIQRVSAGLPASAPSASSSKGNDGSSGNMPLELIFRNLAMQQADPKREQSQDLDALLTADPETAEMAQELIVRMHSGKKRGGEDL